MSILTFGVSTHYLLSGERNSHLIFPSPRENITVGNHARFGRRERRCRWVGTLGSEPWHRREKAAADLDTFVRGRLPERRVGELEHLQQLLFQYNTSIIIITYSLPAQPSPNSTSKSPLFAPQELLPPLI